MGHQTLVALHWCCYKGRVQRAAEAPKANLQRKVKGACWACCFEETIGIEETIRRDLFD